MKKDPQKKGTLTSFNLPEAAGKELQFSSPNPFLSGKLHHKNNSE